VRCRPEGDDCLGAELVDRRHELPGADARMGGLPGAGALADPEATVSRADPSTFAQIASRRRHPGE
jgi:hypothetical protein